LNEGSRFGADVEGPAWADEEELDCSRSVKRTAEMGGSAFSPKPP
jgi:hypothetical protein